MTAANDATDQTRAAKALVNTDAELIDKSVFETTRNAMSNFNMLLDFYRADTDDYLNQIQTALATGQPADAVLPAHTIKSSSRIIGAEALAQLAEKLEAAAKQNDADQQAVMSALYKDMKRAFALTVERIDAFLGREAAE